MEFKHLESFVAIIKYKSFTKAANHLYLSQPTITSHIQALEEELQSQLIVRTTKNIEITDRGWQLYEHASKILSIRDELQKSIAEASTQTIRLGVSTIPATYILPEILPFFQKQYPDITIQIYQNDSQGILNAMSHGTYDIGIVGMPCEHNTLTSIPFYQDNIVMITPVNDYFLNLKNDPAAIIDTIKHYPMIIREDGSGSFKRVNYFLESHGLQPNDLNIIAHITDQEAIKNLTASGYGISFISEMATKDYVENQRLLTFDLPESFSARSFYLVKQKHHVVKPHVEHFLEYVQNFYAQKMG